MLDSVFDYRSSLRNYGVGGFFGTGFDNLRTFLPPSMLLGATHEANDLHEPLFKHARCQSFKQGVNGSIHRYVESLEDSRSFILLQQNIKEAKSHFDFQMLHLFTISFSKLTALFLVIAACLIFEFLFCRLRHVFKI